jgi:hypothetical protein
VHSACASVSLSPTQFTDSRRSSRHRNASPPRKHQLFPYGQAVSSSCLRAHVWMRSDGQEDPSEERTGSTHDGSLWDVDASAKWAFSASASICSDIWVFRRIADGASCHPVWQRLTCAIASCSEGLSTASSEIVSRSLTDIETLSSWSGVGFWLSSEIVTIFNSSDISAALEIV